MILDKYSNFRFIVQWTHIGFNLGVQFSPLRTKYFSPLREAPVNITFSPRDIFVYKFATAVV